MYLFLQNTLSAFILIISFFFHDILVNKGQEYYNVGAKEQKERESSLDYVGKQEGPQEKRTSKEKLVEEVGFKLAGMSFQ